MIATASKNGKAVQNGKPERTLKTSRMLDFFSEKELRTQTGHDKGDWPQMVLKELLDNAIDACEDAEIPPVVSVRVDDQGITVSDNGPGMPVETVDGILDFSARVSSREHLVAPTRGAQGNAMKTIVALPFVLDGNDGRVDISARGLRHEVHVKVDRIRQEPKISRQEHSDRSVKNGTSVKVFWPSSACSILTATRSRFLQIADDFTWMNPHLSLAADWFGDRHEMSATDAGWKKWRACHLTSPHWYSSLERLAAGYIGDDEAKGQDSTVREFVSRFQGLTSTARQKAVLEATGLARRNLSALRSGDGLDNALLTLLLDAMKANSRPFKPDALGVIGRAHLAERFRRAGCEMETFQYRKLADEKDGMPTVVEVAFAATTAAFGKAAVPERRRIITGVNWSAAIAANPFRQLGQTSLDSVLQEQRAGYHEPVVFFMHLACPRVRYTDRGKSAVVIEGREENDGDGWDEER
jgi:DNA topoisomerase VI subunit B